MNKFIPLKCASPSLISFIQNGPYIYYFAKTSSIDFQNRSVEMAKRHSLGSNIHEMNKFEFKLKKYHLVSKEDTDVATLSLRKNNP